LAIPLQTFPIPTKGPYITFQTGGSTHEALVSVWSVASVRAANRRATQFGWLIPRPHPCPESTTRGSARVLPSARADRYSARACVHSAEPVHCTGTHDRKILSLFVPIPFELPFTMPYRQLSIAPRAVRARRRLVEERAAQEAEGAAATAAAAASAGAASAAAECGVALNTAPPPASV